MDHKKNKSKIIMEEVKKRKTQENNTSIDEEKKIKLVIFALFNDYYAFYGSDIKEILPAGNITYVPGSPDFIMGIINVRGDIESVIDITKFLGIEHLKILPLSRIVIASKGNMRTGILLDSVSDVIDIPINSIQPTVSTFRKSIRDFVDGEIIYNNINITLIDLRKIFEKIKSLTGVT